MTNSMPRLPDITATDVRMVNRLTGHLVEAPDLATLGHEFIQGSEKILPADLRIWNVWSLDLDQVFAFETNHVHYAEALEQRLPALYATVQHHPVVAAGHFARTSDQPLRMSDYQGAGSFKFNPLFREVYRHVESHHQIVFTPARLQDCQILLNWNMQARDFTRRELQLLHLLGRQVAVLSRRLEERQTLQRAWSSLVQGVEQVSQGQGLAVRALPSSGGKEGRILAGLIRGETRESIAVTLGWRRDTLDRHLCQLRERLGLENTSQLLQALAALRPAAPPVSRE